MHQMNSVYTHYTYAGMDGVHVDGGAVSSESAAEASGSAGGGDLQAASSGMQHTRNLHAPAFDLQAAPVMSTSYSWMAYPTGSMPSWRPDAAAPGLWPAGPPSVPEQEQQGTMQRMEPVGAAAPEPPASAPPVCVVHTPPRSVGAADAPASAFQPAPLGADDDSRSGRGRSAYSMSKAADLDQMAIDQTLTLIEGARTGQLSHVQTELSKGADPNCKDDKGYTPLIRAAGEGYVAIVEALIKSGADVDTIGDYKSPLVEAVTHGHQDCARMLLEHGALVDLVVEPSKHTGLLAAAMHGQVECVKLMLEYRADLGAVDVRGRTALMLAGFMGGHESVRVLVEAGAELEARCQIGRTAFLWSCAAGTKGTDSVEEFLKAGSNVDVKDKEGRGWEGRTGRSEQLPGPICQQSRKVIEDWLEGLKNAKAAKAAQAERQLLAMIDKEEEADEKKTAAKKAKKSKGKKAKKGKKAATAAESTLAAAAAQAMEKCNIRDTEPAGAWYAAWSQARTLVDGAQRGRLSIVQQELKIGANPNCNDEKGFTPLIRAAGEGHLAVVEALMNAGALTDLVGAGKGLRSPLIEAASHGHVDCARLLLEHGARIDLAVGPSRHTALLAAAMYGQVECLNLLLARNADLRVTDGEGRTALMLAAFMGSRESVRVLVGAGADIEARCQLGRTAFLWACNCGPKGTDPVVELLNAGCDINANDQAGKGWRLTTCKPTRKVIEVWDKEATERRRAQAEQELLAMMDAEEKANDQTTKKRQKKKNKKKKGSQVQQPRLVGQDGHQEQEQEQEQEQQDKDQRKEEEEEEDEQEQEQQEQEEQEQEQEEEATNVVDGQAELQPERQGPTALSDLVGEGEILAKIDAAQNSMSAAQPAMASTKVDSRSQSLKQLLAVPIHKWSSAQLVEWATLQSLPELDSLQLIFIEDEIDGEEFVELKPKMLRRMLKKAGAACPEYSAQVILAQRVDTLKHQQGRSEPVVACRTSVGKKKVEQTERTATVKSVECPFCFEEYSGSDDMVAPRILTKCGHTAWCDTQWSSSVSLPRARIVQSSVVCLKFW